MVGLADAPPTADVLARAKRVKLMLTDCDGVLTDAGVYVSAEGEQMKRFSLRDGMGVERLRTLASIPTGIITREQSAILARRAEKLKIEELHLGVRDKLPEVRAIAQQRGLALDEIAYIGDDVNDLDVLDAVGLAAAPCDAEPLVLDRVHHICRRAGGHGAFREFAELVLAAQLPPAALRPSTPRHA
jgi:3-deoxy-D-manno-octulosonate 8-phosphate phosphatase (KDO 8-P phosphatase)